MSDGGKGKKIFGTVVGIAGILAMIIALVAYLRWEQSIAQSSHPETTVTPMPSVSQSPAPTPLPEPPTDVTPNAAVIAPVYLDQLEPIEDSLYRDSVSWGSATFAHSLTNLLSGCSSVGPVAWVVPVGMSVLNTEIGVAVDANEPESRVTFSVYLDGTLASTNTLGVGEHIPLSVPLAGAQRLTVESIIDESRRWNCNTEAMAVWGDPVLTP
jgi:hypothetical protein